MIQDPHPLAGSFRRTRAAYRTYGQMADGIILLRNTTGSTPHSFYVLLLVKIILYGLGLVEIEGSEGHFLAVSPTKVAFTVSNAPSVLRQPP